MIRVKVCGIRRAEDASAACEAGANALGFNFWKKSPRYILPREAGRIVASIPEGPWMTGVFVDESPARVFQAAEDAGVSVLQFHGNESPEYWDYFVSFRRVKAFKVGPHFQPDLLGKYSSADAFLLDAFVSGMVGGTGQAFDWAVVEKTKQFGRIILAGGLNASNVAEAVRRVRPWGIDVCSGVETEPGKKSPELIRKFIAVVRQTEAELAGHREQISTCSPLACDRELRNLCPNEQQ
ncbi:MAG: phosphoribosylanthranilate isomerase [Acidobacteria bacterium]|nr:phosphoribosylanthranilate isomerase [Acidobacteriota bacterium]